MSVARLARAAIAVALVTIASGAPRAAVALLEDDCCVERCDGEGGESCPPDCTRASCVKVVASVVAPPVASGPLADHVVGAVLPGAHRPVLPVVLGGVFHPPRR